jgi:hypothetical protein
MCLGTEAAVQASVARFFAGLPARTAEVPFRRRALQVLAEAPATPAPVSPHDLLHVDPIGTSV